VLASFKSVISYSLQKYLGDKYLIVLVMAIVSPTFLVLIIQAITNPITLQSEAVVDEVSPVHNNINSVVAFYYGRMILLM